MVITSRHNVGIHAVSGCLVHLWIVSARNNIVNRSTNEQWSTQYSQYVFKHFWLSKCRDNNQNDSGNGRDDKC